MVVEEYAPHDIVPRSMLDAAAAVKEKHEVERRAAVLVGLSREGSDAVARDWVGRWRGARFHTRRRTRQRTALGARWRVGAVGVASARLTARRRSASTKGCDGVNLLALRAANVERRLVTVVVRRADAATLVTRLALLKQPNMSRRSRE